LCFEQVLIENASQTAASPRHACPRRFRCSLATNWRIHGFTYCKLKANRHDIRKCRLDAKWLQQNTGCSYSHLLDRERSAPAGLRCIAKTNNVENAFIRPSRSQSLGDQHLAPNEQAAGSTSKRNRLKHRHRYWPRNEFRAGGVCCEGEVIGDQPFPAPNRSASPNRTGWSKAGRCSSR
jgi:hypothetical protein